LKVTLLKKEGKVYIVGAGPGDPKLLTLKGKECLEIGDVIIYDYLANEMLLTHARKDAEKIYVGKKAGKKIYSQERINELMVSKAKEGKIITRLKGGDPFVFGRGGEEAEELAKAGISFEIVPGVTSAIAAPAYAGIPLTHRDYTSTVAFITGQEDPTRESKIAWDRIPTAAGTLVFFMGSQNLSYIINKLIENGRDLKTPVALIRWGTRADQKTITGDLENIIDKAKEGGFGPPGIIVVGDVVNLRERLRWFEKKPLFGKRIIITRPKGQSRGFAEMLQIHGAEVIEFPTIEIASPRSYEEMDSAISRIEGYDWIIFTSVNGVKPFFERLKTNKKDIRTLKGIRICAIGPKTAKEVESYGLSLDLIPEEYRAESVIDAIGKEDIKCKKILIPRAEVAREVLPDELRNMGAEVDVVTAYRTLRPEAELGWIRKYFLDRKVSAITFTSSSTVKNFMEMFGKEAGSLLNGVVVACIGPVTRKTAEELGIKTDIMPEDYTTTALAEALVKYFS
jgi:uroporphyrinogen III methyltransferase/synthase